MPMRPVSATISASGPTHVPLTSHTLAHFGTRDVQVNQLASRNDWKDSALEHKDRNLARAFLMSSSISKVTRALRVGSQPSDSSWRSNFTALSRFRSACEDQRRATCEVHAGHANPGKSLSLVH